MPFERVELKRTYEGQPDGYEDEKETQVGLERSDTGETTDVNAAAKAYDAEHLVSRGNDDSPDSIDPDQDRSAPIEVSKPESETASVKATEDIEDSPSARPDSDAASDAGSEDSDDVADIDYTFSSTEDGGAQLYRYEVSYCAYHLKRVEELFGPDDRTGPEWTEFEALRATFFREDSPYFRSWVNLLNQVRYGDLNWVDDVKTILPIHVAASNGLTSLVKQLLEDDGTNLTRLTDEGYTALDFAIEYHRGAQKDQDSWYDNSVNLFKILLEAGANVNAIASRQQSTPFYRLFYYNPSLEVVQVFLDHGADLLKRSSGWKQSILHVFCSVCDNAEVLKELLRRGAKLDAVDQGKETPLHSLMQRYENVPAELVKILIEAGADVNAEDEHSQRKLISQLHCSVTDNSRTTPGALCVQRFIRGRKASHRGGS